VHEGDEWGEILARGASRVRAAGCLLRAWVGRGRCNRDEAEGEERGGGEAQGRTKKGGDVEESDEFQSRVTGASRRLSSAFGDVKSRPL